MNSMPNWLSDAALIFVSLFVQGIPFLLAGALLGAVLSAFVPLNVLSQRWPRSPILSALCGALFAVFFPSCDCAVVPVVRRLLQKGIPVSAGVAYLLAAPCLNPICLVSTYLAYRYRNPWMMMAFRAGGSLLIAVIIGALSSKLSLAHLFKGEVLLPGSEGAPSSWIQINPKLGPFARKCAQVLAMAGSDFLNVTTLYIVGSLCSSLLQSAFPLWTQIAASGTFTVPAGMAMAFALSMCSSADAFIANSFSSLPLNGQLAFMWIGPIFNFRSLFVYRTAFQYRAIAGLGLISMILVYLMAFRLFI